MRKRERSTSGSPADVTATLAAAVGGVALILSVSAGAGSTGHAADAGHDATIAVLPLPSALAGTSARAPREIVTAALNEVRRGAVDGREFLTVSIEGRSVGPLACRGTVLRADTAELGDLDSRARIESAALAAMLEEAPVTITVPLTALDCVDGKPTFTDLRPLPIMP